MTRHVQGRVQSNRHPSIQADGRIKDAVEVPERDPSLRLIVHEEAKRVSGVQIQEDAHRRTLLHATLGPLRVSSAVHEPRTLPVYVHAPTFVVFACENRNRPFQPFPSPLFIPFQPLSHRAFDPATPPPWLYRTLGRCRCDNDRSSTPSSGRPVKIRRSRGRLGVRSPRRTRS
ncbi:hypothetical protein WH47_09530 [Habropoda laboriosa]|uniref:Uncharacterized protein n=1 Tax=Habropoda laboriosa TaxID=597456 RepID=A0A0L7RDP1_9HYME|nr:hypothetical protein WH47_09530 [Habropoda laboriosa]